LSDHYHQHSTEPHCCQNTTLSPSLSTKAAIAGLTTKVDKPTKLQKSPIKLDERKNYPADWEKPQLSLLVVNQESITQQTADSQSCHDRKTAKVVKASLTARERLPSNQADKSAHHPRNKR